MVKRKTAQDREEELASFLSNLPDELSETQVMSNFNQAQILSKKSKRGTH